MALAGYPLGLRFRFYDPNPESPAGHLAELISAPYDDFDSLRAFAAGLDVITYEFENVPASTSRFLEEGIAPLFPSSRALDTAQDRLSEKRLFQQLGIPTPAFQSVDTREELLSALKAIDAPAILKTRRMGYDGKGQVSLTSPAEAEQAWQQLGGQPLILEQRIAFERELSILSVRDRSGKIAFYPLVENHHEAGILHLSLAPAPHLSPALQAQAESLARKVLEMLDYVGVLAIELFQKEDQLIANEMAPRVHNSGHWTMEGAVTSQFENHLRAILGFPLGETAPRGCSAMFNLIGALPDLTEALSLPGARLHLYGKQPKPGRKLGHITLCGDRHDLMGPLVSALKTQL